MQLDFTYRPLTLADPCHDSQIYTLTQQIDHSNNFLSNPSFKNFQALPKSVMFIYNVSSNEELSDDDDTSSVSSNSSLESDVTQDTVRSGFTGIIDFEKNEMTIYPPSNCAFMQKESIINIMDIAECLCISIMYICIEKNHVELRGTMQRQYFDKL